MLPTGTPIPDGLVVNMKSLDHPLINVGREISVIELIALLGKLAKLMQPTETVI